jgi:hypothetical protein
LLIITLVRHKTSCVSAGSAPITLRAHPRFGQRDRDAARKKIARCETFCAKSEADV